MFSIGLTLFNFFVWFLSVLPDSPLIGAIDLFNDDFNPVLIYQIMGYVNYFLPFRTFYVALSVWVAAMLIFVISYKFKNGFFKVG